MWSAEEPRRNRRFDDDTADFAPNLMPMLDILCSALGVFIMVFALQAVMSTQRDQPPHADAVMVCRPAGNVDILTTGTETPLNLPLPEGLAELRRLSASIGRPLRLVGAFPDGAVSAWRDCRSRVDALDSIDGLAVGPQSVTFSMTTLWWPYRDGPDSLARLRKLWLSDSRASGAPR
jgi:hypothetical protein